MSARRNGVVVLAIQVALVLSIGVKYAWERHHCPMVWTAAEQYDPTQPIRGRYIALTLYASACDLGNKAESDFVRAPHPKSEFRAWTAMEAKEWRVVPAVRDGELAPTLVDETRPGPTQQLKLDRGLPCTSARLSGAVEYFIPGHAKFPFPLNDEQQLWALVTVPPSGPVRPVKLAVSDASGFRVLNLD